MTELEQKVTAIAEHAAKEFARAMTDAAMVDIRVYGIIKHVIANMREAIFVEINQAYRDQIKAEVRERTRRIVLETFDKFISDSEGAR
jgi:hypothetical protein